MRTDSTLEVSRIRAVQVAELILQHAKSVAPRGDEADAIEALHDAAIEALHAAPEDFFVTFLSLVREEIGAFIGGEAA